MKTLRNALVLSALLAIAVLGGDFLTRRADCADCNPGGTVAQQCLDEKYDDLVQCCDATGCAQGTFMNKYCNDRAQDVYNGCVILHGCPGLLD